MRNTLSALFGALAIGALAFPANAVEPGQVDYPRVQAQTSGGWLMNGRDFSGQRYSPLTDVNAATVKRLGFAWEFKDFILYGRTHRAMQSNPIMVDGVLYFSGPWGTAYAVDARTGTPHWTYDPKADGQYGRYACCDVINRGIAVWQGLVYVGSLDGFLIAVDAKTGKEVWRADTFVDRTRAYTITGAPFVAGENLIIGNAGSEMGVRGYVSAYNAKTGKLAWRFWAIPGDPAKGPDETPEVTMARKTWGPDTRWDIGGGGAAWDSFAYDPETGLAYLGLGNGGPHPIWLRSPSGGDNLFLSSIVAVDAKTGRMKWYYQETPGDSWDYTATSPMVLAELRVGGTLRKVIMQAPKNGIFYVLDRVTGELLKADPYTPVNWTTGIDLKTGRPRIPAHADYSKEPKIIWPSAAGGHAWTPMAFSPQTGFVYVPVYDAPMKMTMSKTITYLPGTSNRGVDGAFPPYVSAADKAQLVGAPESKIEGRLKAWNPVEGKVAWMSEPLPFLNGGTLATAGGLVFQGTSDGIITIYDAAGGKVLHRIATGTAIQAAPISYELDGVQYIAVMAGAGGPQGARWSPAVAASKYDNYERLIVLKLDGGAVPLPSPAILPERQPIPQTIAATPETIASGARHYERLCARCHVTGGAFGAFPDLWNMAQHTIDDFEKIVLGGAYKAGGMGSFADVLSKEDVAAIRAYIVNDTITRRAAAHAPQGQVKPSY